MNSSKLATIGVIAAMLAGTTLATAASDTGAAKRAAVSAKQAEKAIATHRGAKAVAAAETAVALAPQNASYRALLGQAYLTAGRFASAASALADSLSLDPSNGGAALHLALAQIANGQWSQARETLARHEGAIGAADHGLALALAGNPGRAVEVLTAAARAPGADAKTRQNLALSLALAGRWPEAKTVASADVAPGEVDRRIMQWAAFAQPRTASDQVAALLGVVPVADAGQPVQLALNTTVPTVAAVTQVVDTVDAYMPGTTAAVAPAAVVADVGAEVAPGVSPLRSTVAFAPRQEVVQAVSITQPSTVNRLKSPVAAKVLAKTAKTATPRAVVRGNFYVQLGAFESAGVARDAWARLSRGHASLRELSPHGMTINARGASFYRLSVGGYARRDADALCGQVRSRGGRCFVRTGAGDQVAAWSRTQVASR
jgi:Flp pilus assembly protein TadD